MTGHFDNREQFTEMKSAGKLFPYARHVNTVCNDKINNIPENFTGIFITINNGRIENINRTIKTIKRNANGYKNFERLRRRIMWCVNKQGNIILSQRKENES